MFGMRIVGPAVATFMVASFGARSCYLADSVSFPGSALLIGSIAFVQPATTVAPAAPSGTALGRIWTDMKQGMDFIFHHAGLLFVTLALAAGMFALGCFGPLIAVYVREDLHSSTRIFGIASALIGLGMLIGTNVVTVAAKGLRNDLLVYLGLAGIALGLIFLAAVTQVWSTLLGDLIIGFAVAGIVIPAQTMIQGETQPALLGRIGSTVMSGVFTAQIGGLILSGMLAKTIWVRGVFVLCAIVLVLLIGIGCLWKGAK